MASEIYDDKEHEFAVLKASQAISLGLFARDHWPTLQFWNQPNEIVMHTGQQVWLKSHVSYLFNHPEIRSVTDGIKNVGEEGECIVSVPSYWFTYLTREDAEEIVNSIDSDEKVGS